MLLIYSALLASIIIPTIYCQTIYELLESFRFLNEGTISSSDMYQYQYERVGYTEPENVTRENHAWAEGGLRPYLYQVSVLEECKSNPYLNGTDLPGADFLSVIPPAADPDNCVTLCCEYSSCMAWAYCAEAPGDYMGCKKGQPCCYLKSSVPAPRPYPIVTSATMNRTYPSKDPPSGLRSSVPLGGVTTGSIELRGDGTFHEWTVENQSPAGAAKYGVVGDALLAFRLKNLQTNVSDTRLIRTHPNHNFKGISTIMYHGSYPVSKLELIDPTLTINMNLYVYSILKPGDLNRSSTPAIIYSLNIYNQNDYPISVDFMYNAPLSTQIDQIRLSKNVTQQVPSDTYVQCISLCDQNAACASWNWQLVANNYTCVLYSDVGNNVYSNGNVSGVRGQWTYDKSGPLVLDRPGIRPANGQYVLWPFLSSDKTMTAIVNNDINTILGNFSANGGWFQQTEIKGSGANGAVSISTTLQPGEKKTLSILFAWYFPHHNWLDLPLDNYYSLLFNNVTNVGQSIGVDKDDTQLAVIIKDILTLHNLYLDSSLPDYLVDSLINSVSHMRSAMHFANGDWRQWEANDCDDVDSVHNDHQRHLPYILYFPETEKIKMYAWAKYQQADGMIQEALSVGCLGGTVPYDEHGGRRMGDVTTIFILETLELYRWTNDLAFLKDMYPHVLAGVKWQLGTSSSFGLPEHLECTYDIPNMSQYPTTTFNSFLHLAALRACMELAMAMNDTSTYTTCYEPYVVAVKQINQLLWFSNSTDTGYFLAYTGGQGEKAIFADALYGQVLAFTYGLGPLYNTSTMQKHLDSEARLADTPYGLRMLTGREPLSNPQDNSIWMGGSQDWSVLNLWLNVNPDVAFTQSAKGLNNVRQTLNDQWNTHGLYASDGYGIGGKPWCTSHYGFHMVLWHLPFAVSGQYTDLPKGVLEFSPKLQPPFTLPVLIPNTFGSISATPLSNGQTSYTLTLVIGNLSLNELAINNVKYPGSVKITAGESVHWSG
jgi:non-lysosomal glucosylceramidase